MINKIKRYLGNMHTNEVHDTADEQPNCQLDEIRSEHRRWYDSLVSAKADRRYDNCAYCLGRSQR